MSDFLVTGGAGFIGSHLVKSLSNEASIFDKAMNPKDDILDNKQILIASKSKTRIFHLAALTSVPDSLIHPEHYFETNVKGTFNVLEACRKNDISELIFTSSAAVYGNPTYFPIDEKHPLNPLSPYGLSKVLGENLINFYAENYGLKASIFRLFNVYGPGAKGGIINKLRECKLNKTTFPINGDGSQTRDFVHVNDVVKTFISAKPGIFNIGSGKEYSVLDICKHSGVQYSFKPQVHGDIQRSVSSIKKVEQELGFKPSFNLLEVFKNG